MNFSRARWPLRIAVVVAAVVVSGCTGHGSAGDAGSRESSSGRKSTSPTGTVKVDGSSTVFPITEAVAEEFQRAQPNVRVTVGISGTGGGFKKFAAGETDITDASRRIKDSEMATCAANGVAFVELTVAYDGLSVIVNPKNDWVDSLTIAQLKRIWEPNSSVKKWRDVDPKWPADPIKLYGPGTDSGTFDYFTEAINGKEKSCRSDFTASEDDNVLVTGIAADKFALGYFGFAYYAENQAKLKLLAIDGGDGPVKPSDETVRGGTYKPLARPLFIYVKKSSLARPEVAEFVRFYLANAKQLTSEVRYVPVTEDEAMQNAETIEAAMR